MITCHNSVLPSTRCNTSIADALTQLAPRSLHSTPWMRPVLLQVPPSHDVQALADAESQPALVLTRNIEMGDLMLGYEQARQLLLKDQTGRPLLALAEQPGSLIAGTLLRQIFDSSRAFTIDVFDVPYLEQYGAAPDQGVYQAPSLLSVVCAGCPVARRCVQLPSH
jgi:Scramblase